MFGKKKGNQRARTADEWAELARNQFNEIGEALAVSQNIPVELQAQADKITDSTRAALAINPDHTLALVLLGMLKRRAGLFNEAQPFLLRVLELTAANEKRYLLAADEYASCCIALHTPLEAAHPLETALAHFPDARDSKWKLWSVYLNAKAWDESQRVLSEMLERWPDDGQLLESQGELNAARARARTPVAQTNDADLGASSGIDMAAAQAAQEALTSQFQTDLMKASQSGLPPEEQAQRIADIQAEYTRAVEALYK